MCSGNFVSSLPIISHYHVAAAFVSANYCALDKAIYIMAMVNGLEPNDGSRSGKSPPGRCSFRRG